MVSRAAKVSLLSESKRQVRWITPQQTRIRLDELSDHQRDVVLFALATGLRQANARDLRWDQGDLPRRRPGDQLDEVRGKGADLAQQPFTALRIGEMTPPCSSDVPRGVRDGRLNLIGEVTSRAASVQVRKDSVAAAGIRWDIDEAYFLSSQYLLTPPRS